MELIKLTKFQDLFDSDGLDWLTFSEAGIKVKPGSGTSNRQMMLAQLAGLEFPCTEQRLYDWAQGLDDHESFYVKLTRYCFVERLPHGYGIYTKRHTFNWSHCVDDCKTVSFHIRPDKHHHFVKRLHKDFKEKWKNGNALREWGFELGFKPDNIEAPHNWAHWLILSEWTREQAARLICDSDPRQDGLYEALSMLLDRMPSIETQTPFKWLKWFDANGFLSCAPKRILEWYAEEQTKSVVDDRAGSDAAKEPASTKVVISVGVIGDDSESDERQSQLHLLIWRAHQFLSETKKPTAQKLWNEIQFRHESHDTGRIIQEVDGQQILWCSGYGNEQRQLRSTFNKTLSNLRKSPPF